MRKEHSFLLPILLLACFTISTQIHGRNCIKGKPCGNGCIAKSKSCRIDGVTTTTTKPTTDHSSSVIRRSYIKLPKVYLVTAKSVYAVTAPQSKTVTAHYREGQKVFVYKTEDGWARISNMQPEEWLELKNLRSK